MKYVEQFTSYLKKDKTLSLLIRILPFFTVYLEYTKHINEMNFKRLFIVRNRWRPFLKFENDACFYETKI